MSNLPVLYADGTELDGARLLELAEELRREVDKNDLPGYGLCVTCGQQPVLTDMYGFSDIERGVPIDIDTLFRQFSMTKSIVSVAFMTFWEEGRVSLDDEISTILGSAWSPMGGLRVVEHNGLLSGDQDEDKALGMVEGGNTIFFRNVTSGFHIDIDPTGKGRCRWDDPGEWQAFKVFSIDYQTQASNALCCMTLQAHNGLFLDVQNGSVSGSSTTAVTWALALQASDASAQGSCASHISAGSVVSLQHVDSGLYLAVSKASSCEDSSLYVTENSALTAQFKIQKQSWQITSRPAKKSITFRHLLTHCSGLDYAGVGEVSISALDDLGRKLKDRVERRQLLTLKDWTAELAKLPLRHEPGSKYEYGWSLDVLGRVIEVLGEAPLDEVLSKRIFQPLKMTSTYFATSHQDAAARLCALYRFRGQEKGAANRELKDDPLSSLWVPPLGPSPVLGGGGGVETYAGGLLSTIPDYLRFCHMLLGKGSLDGVCLLREDTVKQMIRVNHLERMGLPNIWDGRGWGLLGSIELADKSQRADPIHQPGACGWGGWASTSFRVYPDRDVAFVFMTNCVDSINYEELIRKKIGESLRKKRRGHCDCLCGAVHALTLGKRSHRDMRAATAVRDRNLASLQVQQPVLLRTVLENARSLADEGSLNQLEQEVANLETENRLLTEKQLPEHDFDTQPRRLPQMHAGSPVRALWPETAPSSMLHTRPEARAEAMPKQISPAGDLASQVAEIERFVQQLRPVTQSVKLE
jgi:CubicO group peptidase (beta-lactamase class C family)